MAPSTLGTFLRAFTFGHVRQLDRVLAQSLPRAWAAGAGPGDDRLVVDVDCFVGEVYGYKKQGAGYGYTHRLGYHPIVATRAGTGEVLHIRARKGSANTARGALRFVEELIPRVARAGASGEKLLRADSGFWNTKIMTRLQAAGWTYSIGVRQQKHVTAAIATIPDSDWTALADYPERGEAQIAETMLGDRRLIVRRTRLIGAQAELWPDWRHHAFLTNRTEPLELVEAEHRQHAVVELAIRDLKDQALAHFPSGQFLANAAWTVIAALAHNLLRWTTLIGLPDTIIPAARTLRRRLLTIPGRITRTARQVTLRMPARWPWHTQFLAALDRLRAVPRSPDPPTAVTTTIDAGPRPRPARTSPRRRDGLNWPHPPPTTAPTGPINPRSQDTPTSQPRPHATYRPATVDRGLAKSVASICWTTGRRGFHLRPRTVKTASVRRQPFASNRRRYIEIGANTCCTRLVRWKPRPPGRCQCRGYRRPARPRRASAARARLSRSPMISCPRGRRDAGATDLADLPRQESSAKSSTLRTLFKSSRRAPQEVMCRSSSWVWLISDGVAPAETSTIWFMPRCNVIGMRTDAPRIGTGVVVPFALASITCPFSGTEPGFARAEIAAGSLRGETMVIVTGVPPTSVEEPLASNCVYGDPGGGVAPDGTRHLTSAGRPVSSVAAVTNGVVRLRSQSYCAGG